MSTLGGITSATFRRRGLRRYLAGRRLGVERFAGLATLSRILSKSARFGTGIS